MTCKNILKALLLSSKILYFIFAYYLLHCAYNIYISNRLYQLGKLTDTSKYGRLIESDALSAFYSIIIFVLIKNVLLYIRDKYNNE